jgi:hypothetical protein
MLELMEFPWYYYTLPHVNSINYGLLMTLIGRQMI